MSELRHNQSPVRIPADIDRPDTFVAGLSARQLGILACGLVPLWIAYSATHRFIPLGVFAIFGTPVLAIAIVAAVGSFEGLSADRMLRAALRHRKTAKRLVVAPEGVGKPFSLDAGNGAVRIEVPSPLRLPFCGVDEAGVIDLGSHGAAVIGTARCVSFSLRTIREKEALISGFASYLNSLSEPVQIVCRAEPIDMGDIADEFRVSASRLTQATLARAALDHAEFLETLAKRRDLYVREVLVVLRQPPGHGGICDTGRLLRRAEEATAALSPAGVTVDFLDGASATGCLIRCLDPEHASSRPSPQSTPDEVITGGRP